MKKIDYKRGINWIEEYWWLITVIILPISIVGSTSFYFIEYVKENIEVPLVAIGVITGIEALIITSFFQNKTNKINGLMHAFSKLNDPNHRKNRGIIFRNYAIYTNIPKLYPCALDFKKKQEDLPDQRFPVYNLGKIDNDELHNAMKEVRSDLDEIGSMLNHNLLSHESLLEVYWGTIIRAWVALYGNTRYMRNEVISKYFMIYFQELAYEAWQYWKNKHPEKPVRFYVK